MLVLLLLLVPVLVAGPLLVAAVAHDGRGWRPPPSVRLGEEGERSWPR